MTSAKTLHQRRQRSLARVRRLAPLLDEAVRIPVLGVRVGLDSILGLVPGIGDAAGLVFSGAVIAEGFRMRAPKRILWRMAGITVVDFCVGAIPIAGDLFDIYWKANTRNLGLLEEWLDGETTAATVNRDGTGESISTTTTQEQPP